MANQLPVMSLCLPLPFLRINNATQQNRQTWIAGRSFTTVYIFNKQNKKTYACFTSIETNQLPYAYLGPRLTWEFFLELTTGTSLKSNMP